MPEIVQTMNQLLGLGRAMERIEGRGGARVYRAEGNIVVTVAPGDSSSGAIVGGSGGGSAGSGGISVSIGELDTDGSVIDYGDIAGELNDITSEFSIALEKRIKGGTASLVGFAEFSNVSTPPRRYLTKTYAGSLTAALYTDSTCTNPVVIETKLGGQPVSGLLSLSASFNGIPVGNATINYTVSGAYESSHGSYRIDVSWTIVAVSDGFDANRSARVYPSSTAALGGFQLTSGSVSVNFATGEYSKSGSGAGYFTYTSLGSFPVTVTIGGDMYSGPYSQNQHVIGELRSVPVSEQLTYTGSMVYNVTSGNPEGTGNVSGVTYDAMLSEVAVDDEITSVNDAASRYGAVTVTATTAQLVYTLGPSGSASSRDSGSRWHKLVICNLTETLTAEDSDEDAKDRMITGLDYGDWTTDVAGSTVAEWTERAESISFTYTEGQLKVTYSNTATTPSVVDGNTVLVRVEIMQLMNGTASLYQTIDSYGTIGAVAGEVTATVTPPSSGIALIVGSINIFK